MTRHMRELLADEPLDVIQEIIPGDPMYVFAPGHYFEAGRQALRCIRLALVCGELDEPKRILDFASGSGRVMRYLKPAFPNAALTACDIHFWQAEFCQRVFGATAVAGKKDPEEIELDGPFDLIWCGSHFSHLDSHRWSGFLELFESVLAPGGVLVFTTLGHSIVHLLRTGKSQLNLTEEQVKGILRDYDQTGFGFRENRFDGDSIASPWWVCRELEHAPSLELLLYMEHAWSTQDVVACRKPGATGVLAR